LLLLNTYPLLVSEDLVFRSKEVTLQSSVSVMVYSLSGLDQLNEENVAEAMAVVEETGLSRILVTDSTGKVLYDTRETGGAVGDYALYTEIVQALLGQRRFHLQLSWAVLSAAGHPRRCCIEIRSSARYARMSTIRSRAPCWKGCRATCCGCPSASVRQYWC